jgi:hypothetical protein
LRQMQVPGNTVHQRRGHYLSPLRRVRKRDLCSDCRKKDRSPDPGRYARHPQTQRHATFQEEVVMNHIVYGNMNHTTRRYVNLLKERDELLESGDIDRLQEIEEILYDMQDNRLLDRNQVGQCFA